MSVVGNVTIQTLYTIAGLDNPLIVEPALKRQVEHRSGELSRRGFLGLTAAGAAGLVAGSVFDPVTKLWTPAPAGAIEIAEAGVVSMDQSLMRFAVMLAERADNRMVAPDVHGPYRGWDRVKNIRAYATGRPEDLDADRLWWEADGLTDCREFNERVPLPVQPVERDPKVRVADVLSPKRQFLCRAIAYAQWDGMRETPMVETYIVGRYNPDIVREPRHRWER